MSNTELDDDTYAETQSATETHQNTRRPSGGSVSDFLQRERTIGRIKSVVLLFAATGVGLGIIGSMLAGSVDGYIGGIVGMVSIIPIALLTPVVGVVAGNQLGRIYTDTQPIQLYALIAVTTGAGAISLFMIGSTLSVIGTGGPSVVDLLTFSLVVAIGTVIAAGAAGFTARSWD